MTSQTLHPGVFRTGLPQQRGGCADAVESAVESERRRFARELHDGLAQDLTALSLAVEMATEPEDLGQVAELARRACEEVRRQMSALHPPRMSGAMLAKSLRELASRARRQSGAVIEVDDSRLTFAPGTAGYDLVRVAGEAVQNALRHGGARTVSITLTDVPDPTGIHGDQVRLRVVDDGTGFDRTSLRPRADGSGRGLGFMRERIEELYGVFVVQSEPGRGTSVMAEVPARRTTVKFDRSSSDETE